MSDLDELIKSAPFGTDNSRHSTLAEDGCVSKGPAIDRLAGIGLALTVIGWAGLVLAVRWRASVWIGDILVLCVCVGFVISLVARVRMKKRSALAELAFAAALMCMLCLAPVLSLPLPR